MDKLLFRYFRNCFYLQIIPNTNDTRLINRLFLRYTLNRNKVIVSIFLDISSKFSFTSNFFKKVTLINFEFWPLWISSLCFLLLNHFNSAVRIMERMISVKQLGVTMWSIYLSWKLIILWLLFFHDFFHSIFIFSSSTDTDVLPSPWMMDFSIPLWILLLIINSLEIRFKI